MLIGEFATATGPSSRAMRSYEADGLLPKPDCTPSGYRDYSDPANGTVMHIGPVTKHTSTGPSVSPSALPDATRRGAHRDPIRGATLQPTTA